MGKQKSPKHSHLMIFMRALLTDGVRGVSNRRTGIWNRTMEWKMEWNSERAQLELTRVTGAAQSRLNYLVYF